MMYKKCSYLLCLSLLMTPQVGLTYWIDSNWPFDSDDFSHRIPSLMNHVATCQNMSTDIEDKGDYYMVTSDVHSTEKKDIKVYFKKGVLTITLQKPEAKPSSSANYLIKERFTSGQVTRSFYLPHVDAQGDVDVKLDKGILNIRIPKIAQDKGRILTIH